MPAHQQTATKDQLHAFTRPDGASGFNRPVEDGLIHVVYFWMAPKEPPSWTEVPGLRERAYGSFRLDLGVYVPEMNRIHQPRSGWINDYDCQLRTTIGRLLGSSADLWWQLDAPNASAVAAAALIERGLPWLNSLATRRSVIEAIERAGPLPFGMGPAGWLDLADLYRATGDFANERRVMEHYVGHSVLTSHAAYLIEYLNRTGHNDLVARVTTR